MRGKTEMVRHLLEEENAPVDCKDNDGWTPLMHASAWGRSGTARLLLEKRASINLRLRNERTALMIAVVNRHASVVDLLLQYGADTSIRNKQRLTAAEMARNLQYGEIERKIRSRESKARPEEVRYSAPSAHSRDERKGMTDSRKSKTRRPPFGSLLDTCEESKVPNVADRKSRKEIKRIAKPRPKCVTPRVVRFKEAFDLFKKHEAKKSSASRAARRGGPWKAGTGYGSGNTSKDSARIRKLKLEHEAREAKRRTEIVSIARAVNAQLSAPVLDSAFVQALSESSVLPWLASVFKQTSALEMQKEARLVSAAIDITEAMASRDELTPLLLPSDGETRSLQKVLADQRASAEMMLKFTKGGLDVRVKELLARLVGASKAVAAAVRAHRRRQQGAPPIFPRDGKKAATGPPRKMVSGTAYKSEMYGLVDEKQYMELLRSSLFVEMPDFKRHHYRKGPCKSSVVSAAWTTRLGAELVGLSKSLPLNPNSSVFFRCCAKDMSKAKMIIAAPPSTPYGYGLFLFDVYFPPTYPSVPPKVNLMTTGHASVRFNPNLYNNGNVCLSLLGTWSGSPEEMWQPNQSTFLQVCVSIQSLIFIENPYFNEPGYEMSMNTATGKLKSRQYNSIREVATVQWAMLDMLKNPPPGFEDAVRAHFFLQQKNICAQIEAWLELPEHRKGQLKSYYVQLQKELAKLKEPSAPADDLDEDDDEDDDDF